MYFLRFSLTTCIFQSISQLFPMFAIRKVAFISCETIPNLVRSNLHLTEEIKFTNKFHKFVFAFSSFPKNFPRFPKSFPDFPKISRISSNQIPNRHTYEMCYIFTHARCKFDRIIFGIVSQLINATLRMANIGKVGKCFEICMWLPKT